MAKQLIKYVANDGKEFDTAEMADAHDRVCAQEGKIAEFLAAAKLTGAQATLAGKRIRDFLGFLEGFAPPVAEEKPAEAAEAPVAETAEA